ncbi:MAG: phosphatidate cytidylyltransferase [Clostridiales bacterium]|nr:phosphatidate cytidylyltransferase [Clostridiales bacterium]
MKVRVIVGISCALFAIGCLTLIGYGHGEWVSIAVAVISALSVHEIMNVTGCKNKLLTGISIAFAVFLTGWLTFDIGRFLPFSGGILYAAYVLFLLLLMLRMYSVTRFENIAFSLVSSTGVPLALMCVKFIPDYIDTMPDIFSRSNAVYIILISMFSAWLNDTFALFTGMKFGKHKLAPTISPKKSVEGAVGGVVGTTVFSLAAFFICDRWFFHFDTVRFWMVLIFTPVLCVMGICGDLTFSVIKRNYGVKDFGTLLPGHGGATDRIDSFLFSIPTAYILLVVASSLFLR